MTMILNYFFDFNKDSSEENERSIKKLFSLYKEVPEHSAIEIKPLVEGLTNQLFKISIIGTEKTESYIIRVFGHDTSVLVDRARETYVLSIVDPDLLKAKFDNGIILRYEEGGSLVSKQLIFHQEKIARKLAQLHKRPLFRSLRNSSPKNEFFEQIDSWISAGKNKDANWSLTLTNGITIDFEYLDRELDYIKNIIYSSGYKLVCSHNDLNAENIVFNENAPDGGSVTFIDYEYAMNNVRAFDIANHFCEYAGVTTNFNFDEYFPPKDVQLPFLAYYLEEFNSSPPTDEQIEDLYNEVNRCVMLSHFLWGLWGVVQKYLSKLNFDFIFYAKARFDEYHKGRTAYADDLKYL